jgi:hypothetical protein
VRPRAATPFEYPLARGQAGGCRNSMVLPLQC